MIAPTVPARPQEDLGHPALSFVRVACHLLALDARVAEAVGLLRRQLLRLLHVKEFSAAAEFKELCQPFVLPDVICGWVRSPASPVARIGWVGLYLGLWLFTASVCSAHTTTGPMLSKRPGYTRWVVKEPCQSCESCGQDWQAGSGPGMDSMPRREVSLLPGYQD